MIKFIKSLNSINLVLQHWLLHQWYDKKFSLFIFCLLPFSFIFRCLVQLRRYAYTHNLLRRYHFSVPIIIVGNINVGGSGKTPLLIALYFLFKQRGYNPGIISRGYGGDYKQLAWVMTDSDPKIMGDEPVLIAKRTGAPVVVAKQRHEAVAALLADTDCDIILSDDGLQHYRLARTLEIAVIDGNNHRGLGNQFCLPAGPLREPIARLNSVDLVLQNGGEPGRFAQHMMSLSASQLINLANPLTTSNHSLNQLDNAIIHAVAGIGHPERFFDYLSGLGAKVIPHAFADHHVFQSSDFAFAAHDNYLIIMTEKDAVKCQHFATENMWFLPVSAKLDQTFEQLVLDRLV